MKFLTIILIFSGTALAQQPIVDEDGNNHWNFSGSLTADSSTRAETLLNHKTCEVQYGESKVSLYESSEAIFFNSSPTGMKSQSSYVKLIPKTNSLYKIHCIVGCGKHFKEGYLKVGYGKIFYSPSRYRKKLMMACH